MHQLNQFQEETMELTSLNELLIQELQDLYDGERQITVALPKMAQACSDSKLKAAFEQHLKQTEEHISRLEECFTKLGEQAEGKPCKGIQGLIEEGEELIS